VQSLLVTHVLKELEQVPDSAVDSHDEHVAVDTQLPLWQVVPPVQTLPQNPQLLLSLVSSTQRPLQ